MKKGTVCLLLALGGAVVGAAVAMLVTPQSGRELRGKIRTAINEAQERMRHGHCGCEGEGCDCDE
ncbi:MAG: YtxH domain-containing protein [Alistipes sp.]|nr:YtxH domain-containing protein [Alistipes sp.]